MIKEVVSKTIPWGYTTTVLAASAVDMYVHKVGLHNDEWVYVNRQKLPPIIAEHIGNFAPTALPAILMGAVGILLSEYGRQKEKPAAEKIGKLIPFCVVTAAAVVNVLWEFQGLRENVPDVAVGGLAIVSASVVLSRLEHHLQQRRQLTNNNLLQYSYADEITVS